jgi:hypothetical protein
MSWSRRKFMIAGAVGVGAQPLLAELSNLVPEARAAVVPEAVAPSASKPAAGFDRSKCAGCQVCKIMYSNCMTLNKRVCWLENSEEKTS